MPTPARHPEAAPLPAAEASVAASQASERAEPASNLVLPPRIIDLGRMPYDTAYRLQCDHLEEVLTDRAAAANSQTARARAVGAVLLVEHDPVVTIGRRPGAVRHLVATPELLAMHGVDVVETDRGGDVTYHGPGQLVCYPIVDLNLLKLGLHAYMRLLEDAVIAVCGHFGIEAGRDQSATGVWVAPENKQRAAGQSIAGAESAKICAMGVRVRRWITMHGLALNVTTNLDHFKLIVPCGLAGRPVTSLERELEAKHQPCPPMDEVKAVLVDELTQRLRP